MTGVLILLAAAIILAGPAALVLVLVTKRQSDDARKRLIELERRLASPGAAPDGASGIHPAVPARPAATMTGSQPPVGIPQAARSPRRPDPEKAPLRKPAAFPGDLETVVGGQWLTWIGVLAIFFGTAFFLAYDLGESPFAGVGQILTGLVVGALFIAVGSALVRRRTQRFLGQGLLGGGVALLYLAAYASYGFHRMVPTGVVYPFLFGVALVGAAVAIIQNSLMVATLTLTGAFLTPSLLPAAGDSTRALLPYLVAVNLGAVLIAARRRWPILPLGAWLGTAILVGTWWSGPEAPGHRGAALLWVGLMWALYAMVPVMSPPRRGFWSTARAVVTVANGLAFSVFLYRLMAPGYEAFRGLAFAILALAYVGAARAVALRRGGLPGVRMTHYTGIALAVLAVPIQFDLAWITLAWALMGLVLVAGGFQTRSLSHRLIGLGVYALAVFRVLILDTAESFQAPARFHLFLNPEFLTGVAAVGVLALTAWLYSRHGDRLEPRERGLVTFLVIAAAALLLWRISTESMVFFKSREALEHVRLEVPMLLTLSLIWAVYAGLLIVAGFLTRYRPIRLLGVVVLGILIVKVFAFDMRALERGYRIASFVAVGLLLLAISVLYQRERRT